MAKEQDNELPEYVFRTGDLWMEVKRRLVQNQDMVLPVRVMHPNLSRDIEMGRFYASIQMEDDQLYLQFEFNNANFADALVRSNSQVSKVQEGIYHIKIE